MSNFSSRGYKHFFGRTISIKNEIKQLLSTSTNIRVHDIFHLHCGCSASFIPFRKKDKIHRLKSQTVLKNQNCLQTCIELMNRDWEIGHPLGALIHHWHVTQHGSGTALNRTGTNTVQEYSSLLVSRDDDDDET